MASPATVSLRLILLLQVLEAFAYFTLNNILTLHLTSIFGVSDSVAGLHFGLRGAMTTIVSTIFGPLIDHIGAFQTLPLAFALAAVGRAIFGLSSTLQMSLVAMYIPMAAGHGLTNAALVICIKRAVAHPGGPSAAWAFALQYCALVLGITVCGPAIDLATMWAAPSLPYRGLALVSAACSLAALALSLVLLRQPTAAHAKPSLAAAPLRGRSRTPIADALREFRSIACTARFARYAAFSLAILPGCAVLRNLDGGIFPKFMVRTFGPTVPKGTIYALNPLLDMVLVPTLSSRLRRVHHFPLIRGGLTVAALSPLLLLLVPPSIVAVIAFVLLLTIGDALYNPRLSAYAMAVAPTGREGSFAGLSAAILFLAELPAGLIGGALLERHCSQAAYDEHGADGCDAHALFGSLAAFASLTPLALWIAPVLLREPSADTRGEPDGGMFDPVGRTAADEAAVPSEREMCAAPVDTVSDSDGEDVDEQGGIQRHARGVKASLT